MSERWTPTMDEFYSEPTQAEDRLADEIVHDLEITFPNLDSDDAYKGALAAVVRLRKDAST